MQNWNKILSHKKYHNQEVILVYNDEHFIVCFFKLSKECIYIPMPEIKTENRINKIAFLRFSKPDSQWCIALKKIIEQNTIIYCSEEFKLWMYKNSSSLSRFEHKIKTLSKTEECCFKKYSSPDCFIKFYSEVQNSQNHTSKIVKQQKFCNNTNIKQVATKEQCNYDLQFLPILQIYESYNNIDIFEIFKNHKLTEDLFPAVKVVHNRKLFAYSTFKSEFDREKYNEILNKPINKQTKEELDYLEQKLQEDIEQEFYESQKYVDLIRNIFSEIKSNITSLKTKHYKKEESTLLLLNENVLLGTNILGADIFLVQKNCKNRTDLSKKVCSELNSLNSFFLLNKDIYVWNNNRSGLFTLFKVQNKLPPLTLYNSNKSYKPIEVYVKTDEKEKIVEVLPTKKETYQKYGITKDRLNKCINSGVSYKNFFFREKVFSPDEIN